MDATGNQQNRLVGADRVVAVLTELAEHPLGVGLDELADILHSSKPTVHRALTILRRAGLADRVERGVYLLGDEYLRLAFRNLDGRADNVRIQPLLVALADRFGETAHYAVLSNTDIVYRAKMDPPHGSVRLNSVVGGRNPAHSTAVGKALLAGRLNTEAEIENWFGQFPLERRTERTITSAAGLLSELERTLERGYGIDDQENQLGVNCIAVPVILDGGTRPTGAVSVSAVSFRCPIDQLLAAEPEIRDMIRAHLGANATG